MAKPRKKKKPQQPSRDKALEVNKTYFDHYSIVARKVLQLIDLDPDLFDRFTKKQKMDMMRYHSSLPAIKPMPGHCVPRHYLKMIQKELYDFAKISPVFFDREPYLTYADFLIYGVSFIANVAHAPNTHENDAYKELCRKIDDAYLECYNVVSTNLFQCLWVYISYLTSCISKININIYGFNWAWSCDLMKMRIQPKVLISVAKPSIKYFTYNNTTRPAFRAIRGQYLELEPLPISIPYNQIIPESERTHPLEVYVQNHALLRMKERIDIMPASLRNVIFNHSLIKCNTRTLLNGQTVLEMREAEFGLLGFLPFTISGNRLYVLSFLPVCTSNATEGQRLQQLLGISRKDIEFLGMDKLSFFIDNDFEQVPRLKRAIEEAGLAHLTHFQTLYDYKVHNQISTATLLRFFPEEYAYEEELTEVEESA